jgi:hypothetical protein
MKERQVIEYEMGNVNPAALRYLTRTQDTQGGWGFTPGGTPAVEPTALAVLALQGSAEAADAVQRGRDWLVSIQHEDGGWGLNALDLRSDWHTAWAVLALNRLDRVSTALERGRAWLASVPVYRPEDSEMIQSFNQTLNIDVSLAAWSWGPEEASWVIPTGLAMLALRDDPGAAQARLGEAVRYLDNRRVPGGGWNVGNPVMFDGVLPAHVIPTASSLLALRAFAPEIILPEDLVVLREKALKDQGAKALGWSLFALRSLGEDVSGLSEMLLDSQQADGSWEGNPHSTAIALLGLEAAL